MDSFEQRYRGFLEAQGMRLTRERAAIVQHLSENSELFDAERLYLRLSEIHGVRISRSTVYRAVLELEKAHLLTVIEIDGLKLFRLN